MPKRSVIDVTPRNSRKGGTDKVPAKMGNTSHQPEIVHEYAGAEQSTGTFSAANKVMILDTIINSVTEITNSIASAYIKKQETEQMREKTKQVEAETEFRITQEKENTVRVCITEGSETERVKAQVYENLQKMQNELTKHREELAEERGKLDRQDKRFQDKMDFVKDCSKRLLADYDRLSSQVINRYAAGNVPEESLLKEFRSIRESIVEMAAKIAALE